MRAVLQRPRAAAASAPLSRFAAEVLDGLSRRRRRIPGAWLYDRRGALLFEQISALPEHYPSRDEILLLRQCAPAIAQAAGTHATLIELGSGSVDKTPLVLGALDRPAAYVPVHLCERFHAEGVPALASRFPGLPIQPLVADFTRLETLPAVPAGAGRRVVFLSSAALGHLAGDDAAALLRRIARLAGPGSLLVAGVDHTRDPARLLAAYDDRAGVAAAFNKNLLVRINRELEGDFDPDTFDHVARFNPAEPRVEMHLVSACAQTVQVLGRSFDFAPGESIHTDSAHQPSLFQFLARAHRAGWAQRQLWMGAAPGYALHVLENVLGP